MTQETVYKTINGKLFDRPDQALLEEYHFLQHRLAQEVDTLIISGHCPMRYEEHVKELREHFKRFVDSGRVYIQAFQDTLQSDPAPHQKTVIDLQKQTQTVKTELAPAVSEVAA